MREAKVTKYGTIDGDDFEETSINKLLKYMKKRVNRFDAIIHDNMNFNEFYCGGVYKEAGGYELTDKLKRRDPSDLMSLTHYKTSGKYDGYHLKLKPGSQPYLESQLDKLAAITASHEDLKKKYYKWEESEVSTPQEKNAALKYLKLVNNVAKKGLCLEILKVLGIITTLPIGVFLFAITSPLDSAFFILFSATVAALGLTSSIFVLVRAFAEGEFMISKRIRNYIKFTNLTGKKIRQLERKVGKSRNMMQTKAKIVSTKEDDYIPAVDKVSLYGDGVIADMHKIKEAAKGLDEDDKTRIFLQLSDILDEYTNECKKLNEKISVGAKDNASKEEILKQMFENNATSREQILQKMVNKLLPIENEVGRLLEKKNNVPDSVKFRAELDKELSSLPSGKGQVQVAGSGKATRR